MKKKRDCCPHFSGWLKCIITMKLILMFLLISGIGFASTGYSQSAKVSLKFKNESLEKVFKEIEQQTDYFFLFNDKSLNKSEKVSVDLKDESIDKVLNTLLQDKGVRYNFVDRYVVIHKNTKQSNEFSQQAKRKITGTVTDTKGELLPGVSVVVKGTTIGVTTDIDGKFSLEVDAKTVLQFSFVGMKKQDVLVEDQNVLTVMLEEDAIGLEEVVAVGYGTKSRSSMTGSVATLGDEVIGRKINTNAFDAIQSSMPGVTVTRNSGKVGDEGFKLDIRGLSSINGGDALVIIDGVTADMEQLGLINPSDIMDIAVLKDASAAIYGSRAANGVLLVTTKKGNGKMNVSYTMNYSLKTPALYPKRASTPDHFRMADQGFVNDGADENYFTKYRNMLDKPLDNSWVPGPFADTPHVLWGNTDWMDILYDDASTISHDLSISGSSNKTQYLFSLGYLKENSMLQWGTNNNKRYNVRMNYSYNVTKQLKLTSNIAVAFKDLVEPMQINSATGNEMSRAWSSHALYAENGMFYNFGGFWNPAAALELGGQKSNKKRSVNINLKAEYNFDKALEGLKATVVYGINDVKNVFRGASKQAVLSSNKDGSLTTVRPRDGKTTSDRKLFENTFKNYTFHLNYNRTFFDDHTINAMFGMSQEENLYQDFRAWRDWRSTDELTTLTFGDPEFQFNSEKANEWALRSAFARLEYSYKNKFSVEGLFRRDGSSRFIDDYRYVNFYSVLGYYNLHTLPFLKDNGVFSQLKLRASYGESGNQGGIGIYDYLPRIDIGGVYPFGLDNRNIPRAKTANMVSLSRTWEKIISQNIGVDFVMFDEHLSGSFDYFVKKNNNMLVGVVYPQVLGGNPPATNDGKLRTKGFEVSLTWKNKIGQFNYFVTANLHDYTNKLVDLEGADPIGSGVIKFKEGYSLNSIFGYKWDGIIQSESELAEYKKMEGVNGALIVGDAKYADVDGNGKLYGLPDPATGDKGDLVHLGDTNPRYVFSLQMGGEYKGFDFSATFSGVGERKVLVNNGYFIPGRAFWVQPYDYFVGKQWSPNNTNAKYAAPSFAYGSARNGWNWRTSDNMIEDAAYIRLSDIQVAYTFNPSNLALLDKLNIEKLRVYFNGKDLWETTKLPKGFNPDTGMSVTYHPFSRYIGMGLQVVF
ncbi:SusC/RagA family TonB-linked outer membrane protein [Prolixibacteraceae bacterium JC049]|nr:SusC/RagA family TonB-linked outer membrane protein [Prolixibacteraceae bacterium JC049]